MSTANASASKKRHALVTGGGTGIGIAIATALVEQGMNVSVVGRRLDVLQNLANTNPEHIFAVQADVSNQAQVQQAFAEAKAHFGNIEILINNAGSLINKPFTETTTADLAEMLESNVISHFKMIQHTLPLMHSGSHIVNVGSMGGFQGSVKFAGLSAYSTSKAALCSFTELFSEEYKESTIKMNEKH